MARFRFKLENIHKMKCKLEEQAKSEYAEAFKEFLEEEEKLNLLFKKKEQLEQHLRDLYIGRLVLLEIRNTEAAIEKTKDLILLQEMEVKKAERKLERARDKLQEAMKERKIYERLREKAFEEFLIELNKEEDMITDELISYRYGKRQQSQDTQ